MSGGSRFCAVEIFDYGVFFLLPFRSVAVAEALEEHRIRRIEDGGDIMHAARERVATNVLSRVVETCSHGSSLVWWVATLRVTLWFLSVCFV